MRGHYFASLYIRNTDASSKNIRRSSKKMYNPIFITRNTYISYNIIVFERIAGLNYATINGLFDGIFLPSLYTLYLTRLCITACKKEMLFSFMVYMHHLSYLCFDLIFLVKFKYVKASCVPIVVIFIIKGICHYSAVNV